MSVRISEVEYVNQFSRDQQQFIISVCDTYSGMRNLHNFNDHYVLTAVGECSVLEDLFVHPYSTPLESEEFVDDCLMKYIRRYQLLMIENQAMDCVFDDDDLNTEYSRSIYLCQTIIDQLRQKTTDRLTVHNE